VETNFLHKNVCEDHTFAMMIQQVDASLLFQVDDLEVQATYLPVSSHCSSHTSTTATCKQSRPKQGEGKDQASNTSK